MRLFALGFIMFGLMFAAPQSVYSADTIKLGVIGPHTGDLAGYGIPVLNAAKMVVGEVNASGGINGKNMEIIAQDDQCKPELATNAATRLLADGVDIVLGPVCSGATKAALPILASKKLISISPAATSPALTQSGDFPYFFRTIPSDDAQALLAAKFAIQALGAKKIAIIHDKGDYGKGYAEFAKQFVEADGGAQVVFFEGITPGAVDYSSSVQKIGRSGADTLIFGGYYPEASKIITNIRARNMKINFVSEDGVKTPAFLKLTGAKGEGVYASSSNDTTQLPMTKQAFTAHFAAYGSEPGQFFEQGYSAAQAIVAALRKTNSTDSAALMKVLRSDNVETLLGPIRFDDKGDCVGAGFTMFKVVGGNFVDQKFIVK